ncbi:MAG: hypothetical protein ACFFCC_02115 [Promethearchaeota archaeon]
MKPEDSKLSDSKIIGIFKKISFYLILGIIALIFIFNRLIGLWLAGSFFIIYFIFYLVTVSSKRKILRLMNDYLIIGDNDLADKLQRPLDEIRKVLSSLSKNQKNKKWLVVFLNNRYIFLNEKGVENFKLLYNRGYNEKKILETLQNDMKIRSRAEVKAIEIALANHNRLTD